MGERGGRVPAGMVEARLDRIPWTYRTKSFRSLDFCFDVRTTDQALGRHLDRILAVFATETEEPGASYSVFARGTAERPRFSVYFGSRRLITHRNPSIALSYLLWSFNTESVSSTTGTLVMHSGAVERSGVVVMLPASQEAGKTTLVTGLLRRGFRYITDEAVVVDVATGRIRPFPKALGIDGGSWALFPDLEPDVSDDLAPWLRNQWHVPATAVGAELSVGGEVRLIVSPRYRPGDTTELLPMSQAEMLVLLSENSFNRASWGRAGFQAAADLVRRARCALLPLSDLDRACDLVESAVAEMTGARPRPTVGA